MTTRYEYDGRRGGGGAGTLIGVLLALMLGAVALGVFVHNAQTGLAARLAGWITGRSTTYLSAPDVVERVQRLSRLETVVYSLDTVAENKESSALLPDVLAGDKLLMIVHGQTIAGVDFGRLRAGDVQTSDGPQGRSIRVKLPAAQVFLTTLDNSKTRVYARDTGLLVTADPNLESETRAKAQAELQAAALRDGILDTASRNAQDTVRAMLEGLGFAKIDVQ